MPASFARTAKPAGRSVAPQSPLRAPARDTRPVKAKLPMEAEAPSVQAEDEPITFEVSSGNVFADLDVPEAADEAIKARLVMRLRAEMDRRGLSQTEFAKVLGVKQPDVSNLLRGRVLGFSLERMFEFTRALGDDVEITLRPSKAERRGRMSLKVA